MAVIIPFPVSRCRGATRAHRVFHAQAQLEKARRQAALFFGAATLAALFLMMGLELLARVR